MGSRGAGTERRVRRAVGKLVALLAERSPDLTTASGASAHPRHFAGAGLARCRALLEGMYLLGATNGRPDVSGVLLRTLVETWAISLFVLLKGKQGIFDLAPDAAEYLQQLVDIYGGGTPGTAKWLARFKSMAQQSSGPRYKKGPKKGQPCVRQISSVFTDVEKMLASSPHAWLSRWARTAHQRIWKVESYISTHANLASIGIPHIDTNTEPWELKDHPDAWMPPSVTLATGGLLTAVLAGVVYEAFGYRPNQFFDLRQRIFDASQWTDK